MGYCRQGMCCDLPRGIETGPLGLARAVARARAMMPVAQTARFATVVFDADSTLATIEGIDWLAERRAPDVAQAMAKLTTRAMNGELPIEQVYAARIARILPTRREIVALAQAYIEHMVPGVQEIFAALHSAGVRTAIVSGGLRDALLPLAAQLGVPAKNVHAVTLRASHDLGAPDDVFDVLDGAQPLATQRGKVEVLQALLLDGRISEPVAFVGDGSTDAAVRDLAHFIAFTGVVRRPAVVAMAREEAQSMTELARMLW